MMNERNVLAGATATVLSPFVDGWQNLFVWLIVALSFILGNLRFNFFWKILNYIIFDFKKWNQNDY